LNSRRVGSHLMLC